MLPAISKLATRKHRRYFGCPMYPCQPGGYLNIEDAPVEIVLTASAKLRLTTFLDRIGTLLPKKIFRTFRRMEVYLSTSKERYRQLDAEMWVALRVAELDPSCGPYIQMDVTVPHPTDPLTNKVYTSPPLPRYRWEAPIWSDNPWQWDAPYENADDPGPTVTKCKKQKTKKRPNRQRSKR